MSQSYQPHCRIPRIIHRVWFNLGSGSKPNPVKFGPMLKSVKRYHKKSDGWKFYLWDETKSDKFVKKHYPQYYERYDKLVAKIMKIDAIRFFILHYYGGYYIDQDIELYRNLENIPNDYPDKNIFFSVSRDKNNISNYFIASTPKHPIWVTLIENINIRSIYNTHNSGWAVLNAAGPLYIRKQVRSLERQDKTGDVQVLPSEGFLPNKGQKFYGKHNYYSDWVEYCFTTRFLAAITVVISIFIIVASLIGLIFLVRYL